jgi:Ca2+-binding RTX toxin-like protein
VRAAFTGWMSKGRGFFSGLPTSPRRVRSGCGWLVSIGGALAVTLAFSPIAAAADPQDPDCNTTPGPGGALRVGTDGPDTIVAGSGDDVILGLGGNDTLIGGAGQDAVHGGDGNDLVIGDRAELGNANANGSVDHDCVAGNFGNDLVVGDNYAEHGNATGTTAGRDIVKGGGDVDTVVGDNVTKGGLAKTASGAGQDWLAGSANGDSLVIGDNYAPTGTAQGGAGDSVNTGPGPDVAVGDNYSRTGLAKGGGDDNDWNGKFQISGPFNDPYCSDGTTDTLCHYRGAGIHVQEGNDRAYGDSYSPNGVVGDGGGEDEIGGYHGADILRGGPQKDVIHGDCLGDPSMQECRDEGGNDDINGQGGPDKLFGYWGNDICDGGALDPAVDTFDPSCETVRNKP